MAVAWLTIVAAAQAAAGDKYVNIIGAQVARECLEAGLLDEICVFIVPVLLGDGVPLFRQPGGMTVKLERISQSAGSLAAYLWYRVVR